MTMLSDRARSSATNSPIWMLGGLGLLPAWAGALGAGQACQPTPAAQLSPQDASIDAQFGWAVGASEHRLVVGAPSAGLAGEDAGAAFVFDAATGAQTASLRPVGGPVGARFGEAVAVRAGLALVGAPGDAIRSEATGAAYLFDAASGELLTVFAPPFASAGAGLGRSVAIGDRFAIVGAPNEHAGQGAAYVLDLNSRAFITELNADEGEGAPQFGGAVAAHGMRAMIGATGRAYLFNLEQDGPPMVLEGGDGKSFGWSVGLDADRAVVGSPFGAKAVVFDAATGAMIAELTSDDAGPTSGFGSAVAVREGVALVGAPGANRVYAFDADTGDLLGSMGGDGVASGLGQSVAIGPGGAAIAGAPSVGPETIAHPSGSAITIDLSPCSAPGCPGDLDGDGSIGAADLGAFMDQLGGGLSADGRTPGDLDGDADVDQDDLAILLGAFGDVCG